MTAAVRFDVVVIGGGPAGQKAAIQAAKAGRRVLVVEQEARAGGGCVRRGTIPSKTLHETACSLERLRRRGDGRFDVRIDREMPMAAMTARVREVVDAHQDYMTGQLERNDVELWHGRARFVSRSRIAVGCLDGSRREAESGLIVIATGSRPRDPSDVPVDHEHVLDSDSILSLRHLPESLVVLGGGVIASEYASIFATLGVRVTMVDRATRPLSFMDEELVARFVGAFEDHGGRFLGDASAASVAWDGVSMVRTVLDDGRRLESEKLLFALGRVANLEGLDVGAAGLQPTSRGVLEVDECGRTGVEGIYAVGDVAGPPGLAASAMEQGRRAIRHALGLDLGGAPETIPFGVYTIPEISCVGLTEPQARERHGEITVGRASFDELARGQISGDRSGMLKLIADGEGRKILGVGIIADGATELVHTGQIAMISGWEVGGFIENIFNFPTLAEAYRVAALDIAGKKAAVAAR